MKRKQSENMLSKLSVLALLLALVDVSRASEVNQSVQKNGDALINSAVLNKKLLPNVKHLLKEGSDGNRQKFLRLLDGLHIDGFKVVDGKYRIVPSWFTDNPSTTWLCIHSASSPECNWHIFVSLIIQRPREAGKQCETSAVINMENIQRDTWTRSKLLKRSLLRVRTEALHWWVELGGILMRNSVIWG